MTKRPRLSILALVACLGAAYAIGPSAAAAETITLLVDEDTSSYTFFPTLPRFNNPSVWAVRGEDEGGGSIHDFETFLWFDVSLADIPAGHVLTQAQLLVTWSFDDTGFGTPSTEEPELNCHEVTEDWDQTTLTAVNSPAFDPPFDAITGLTGFGPIVCDATLVVFDWIHGTRPNYGFALTNDVPRALGMHALEAAPEIPDALKANLILTTELPEPGFATALMLSALGLATTARKRAREESDR